MNRLDDVDRKIITQLQKDGRTTFEALGKLTGYTSMGAKKRMKKLLDEGSITISALLNVKQLEFSAALVFLEMEHSESLRQLLERFRDCPRVVQIFTALGGYNLIAIIVAENRDVLESISLEKCSLRSGRGIRRSEFYPIGNIDYTPFLFIREYLTHKERTITPCGVDCRPCPRYLSKKCVGCPTANYYQGPL